MAPTNSSQLLLLCLLPWSIFLPFPLAHLVEEPSLNFSKDSDVGSRKKTPVSEVDSLVNFSFDSFLSFLCRVVKTFCMLRSLAACESLSTAELSIPGFLSLLLNAVQSLDTRVIEMKELQGSAQISY